MPMPPVVAIVGPTATGKSRLGMLLAAELGGEIVNADALQVYRGFDIGTAKPSLDDRRRVPHHLVDVLDPHQRYSAGEFARRARLAIAEIEGRGRLALVVGGSGLYLRALLRGISPVPPGNPEVRRALRRRLAAAGLGALVEELRRVDPDTAARLSPGDSQRVLRALEVARVSGEPLSAWIARQPFGERRLAAVEVGLTLPRTILYDRIEGRTAGMFRRGWVAEVEGLLGRGVGPHLPAFQAIGYRQISHHLLNGWSLARAEEETVRATRRFAKRQLTWFRKETGVTWFTDPEAERRDSEVLSFLRSRGVGGDEDA
jgi:tRNA dimethylallyltransferase